MLAGMVMHKEGYCRTKGYTPERTELRVTRGISTFLSDVLHMCVGQ